MAKYIKREVLMINFNKKFNKEFCLCEFLDKVMKNRFPGKEVSCSRFVTEKMSGVVYSNKFSRNDAKMQFCMLEVTEIEEDKCYNLLLEISDEGEVLGTNDYHKTLLTSKEIKKNVYDALEKRKLERIEKVLAKSSTTKKAKQEETIENVNFEAIDSSEEIAKDNDQCVQHL